MKRLILVIGALILCTLPVLAQDVPKAEIFMGFEYVRFNPVANSYGNPNFNMYGGGGSVMYNINKAVGLKAEFSGVGAGNMTICAQTGLNCVTRSGNFFNYLFGPQFTIRKERVAPFVHLLFGGAYSNVYGNIQTAGTIPTTQLVADFGKNAFSLAAGGGLDVKVSKSVAVRVFEFDYLMTRFSGRALNPTGTGTFAPLEINNQSNIRLLAGLVFHIGQK